jgi:hypothetical protein
VAWVNCCRFCGVTFSGGGARAIATVGDREPSQERFEEEGEHEVGEGVPMQVASVDVDRWGGAVGGIVVGGRDST